MDLDKKTIKKLLLAGSSVLLVICVVICSFILFSSESDESDSGAVTDVASGSTATLTPTDAQPATPSPSPEPITYTEMTLLSTGDYMMHGPQMTAALQSDGTYDFSEYTKYINDIVSEADYAVLNVETTIVGDGNYSSYPSFNSPEEILDSITGAGFDMCLFANNHTYDKGHLGLINTQNFFAKHNLNWIGTRTDTESKSYKIIEVNGIKIGMLNYTYETDDEGENVKFLNGTRLDTRSNALVDSFNLNRMDKFYSEVSARMNEMKKDGADAIVMYIHWGDEYDKRSNSTQQQIAQKLCDLGVDALIGSHPHVVQEAVLLTSADGKHTMPCLYSTGNFISNQNRLTLVNDDPEGYSENSVLHKLTFRKYSSGETVIVNTEYIATWVHRRHMDGRWHYSIVPLVKALTDEESKEYYSLYDSSFGVSHATVALQRIDALLKDGTAAANAAVVLPYDDSEVTAVVKK